MEKDWLKKWSLFSPQITALMDGDSGQKYSYHDCYHASQKAAQKLQSEYHIKAGERIAVLAENHIEYVLLFFAVQRCGAILVPINNRLTAREIDYIIQDSKPSLLFFEYAFREVIEEIPAVSRPKSISLDGADGFNQTFHESSKVIPDIPMMGNFEDPAMILYTSGTTGFPKGAVLTHESITWNAINTSMRLNITPEDKAVIFLPLYHTGGWNVLTTPFFHQGATTILTKKFDGDQILSLSNRESCTIIFGVPTTLQMMSDSKLFHELELDSVRYAIVGGEAMPISLIKKWHQKGIKIRQGFGLTEFGPNCFSLNEEDAERKIGSIGFPYFYNQARIVDTYGKEVAPGEIGELTLKGPMCMKEYWNNPKATSETIREGWLHTGDLVKQDEEGYYYVVGRQKDMYISGGENVYPSEVEAVIHQIPGIQEVAVIGVKDDRWGEVGKAFITAGQQEIKIDQIKEHCLKNLAKFKIPKYFEFLDELPKGHSGKILKKDLR